MSKRLLLINSVCGIGSTGRICADIAREYERDGYEVKIAYGRSDVIGEGTEKYAVRIGNKIDVYAHVAYTRLFDKHGLASKSATKKFLEWADEYDPDILWLHNIHGYYINYELLFGWIKTRQKKQSESGKPVMEVKWTLHDCWAFTGHCSHFTYVGCDKWKTGCKDCPQKLEYPSSLISDNSENNFVCKKKAFTGVKKLTLITPSHWLKNLVKNSFLNEYLVEVVYNTVDANVFKPTQSDFRQKNGIDDDLVIILGVSSVWNKRKGLDDFWELDRRLDKGKYRIILVGVSDKQANNLRKNTNILPLPRITNQVELAEIYSASDIYLNLSKEESFGLTTMEALYCGVKVIVYKDTACEEVLKNYDVNNGLAVDKNTQAVCTAITRMGQKSAVGMDND